MSDTKKITTTSWVWWKANHPDVVSGMPVIRMSFGGGSFFTKAANKIAANRAVSGVNTKYGPVVGAVFDWLDDTCEQPYYVEYARDDVRRYRNASLEVPFTFYFMDEGDAVAFKLTFFEPGKDND